MCLSYGFLPERRGRCLADTSQMAGESKDPDSGLGLCDLEQVTQCSESIFT